MPCTHAYMHDFGALRHGVGPPRHVPPPPLQLVTAALTPLGMYLPPPLELVTAALPLPLELVTGPSLRAYTGRPFFPSGPLGSPLLLPLPVQAGVIGCMGCAARHAHRTVSSVYVIGKHAVAAGGRLRKPLSVAALRWASGGCRLQSRMATARTVWHGGGTHWCRWGIFVAWIHSRQGCFVL